MSLKSQIDKSYKVSRRRAFWNVQVELKRSDEVLFNEIYFSREFCDAADGE